MKKILAITLLLIGFTLALASTPINTAGGLDDVPEPHAKPFSQKDVM